MQAPRPPKRLCSGVRLLTETPRHPYDMGRLLYIDQMLHQRARQSRNAGCFVFLWDVPEQATPGAEIRA